MRYAAHAVTERFEQTLGDPNDPGRTFSLARCVELDEREEFPTEICRVLDEAGVPGYYVPQRHGGDLRSFEDLFQIFRLVARRDLTTAIAHHKTFLGAVSIWVADEPAQAKRLAADVLTGRVVSWGLTEPAHGSDLLAGEMTAERTADGYRMRGDKWLINNATRADLVCVLARTDPAGGARGLTVLLADKRELPASTYRCLQPVRTHGIRGADISGIGFDGAELPASAVVGEPGQGLEIVLKGFQLTRTLCAALSLGAIDRGLRLATGFALRHRMFDRPVADLPQTRRTLVESYADLLVAEAVGIFAARAIHALPGELAPLSAVAKYLVPTIGDEVLARLGQLLGARAFLRDTFALGVYQKVERDHRIVGIFDGSTVVNLNSLIQQFSFLSRGYHAAAGDEAALHMAVDLSEPLPEFSPARLELVPRRGATVVNTLPAAVVRLTEKAAAGLVRGELVSLAEAVRDEAAEIHTQMDRFRPSPDGVPAEAFDLAERYTALYAAAVCLWLGLGNQQALAEPSGDPAGELWRDGRWMEACMIRLLDRIRPPGSTDQGVMLDALFPALRAQYQQGLLFSPLHCRLAEASVV